MKSKTCLLKYRGDKTYKLISRARAAYLFRAARSRRRNNVSKIGDLTYRIEDCSVLITI